MFQHSNDRPCTPATIHDFESSFQTLDQEVSALESGDLMLVEADMGPAAATLNLSHETKRAKALWNHACGVHDALEKLKVEFEVWCYDSDSADAGDKIQSMWAFVRALTKRSESAMDCANARYHRSLFADVGAPISSATTPSS